MIKNAIASLAVKNIGKAGKWYEKFFGRPADSRPEKDLYEWRFAGGGWLQIYLGEDRAGNGSCTLAVANLGDEIARLRAIGVNVGTPTDSSTVSVIMIKDPDGNSIALAEAMDHEIAQ